MYFGREMEKLISVEDRYKKNSRVININCNNKHKILEDCRILGDYSRFIEITRKQCGDKNRLENAVKTCISRDILKDYLKRKASEVINMLMVEYDYDTDMKVQRNEGINEGMKEEIKMGISALVSTCRDFGKSRSETRECLIKKYSLSDKDADAYMDEFWK